MLYKNTVFYNQMSPFPAIIFVSNMYIKSVTVHYVNPIASSLLCTSVLPLVEAQSCKLERFLCFIAAWPFSCHTLFVRVRQKLQTALRDADFRNLFRMSDVRDCGLGQEIFQFLMD